MTYSFLGNANYSVGDAAVKSVLADASLSQVYRWLSAELSPSAYPGLCFGWVEWSGGPIVQANFDRKKAVDEFFIVIITKNADADQAEIDGLSLAEKAEALFSADRKLGGAVTDSLVTLREKQKVFYGKFSINAVRLTLDLTLDQCKLEALVRKRLLLRILVLCVSR